MRINLKITGLFIVSCVLIFLFFFQIHQSQKIKLLEGNGGIIIERSDCTISLKRTEDGNTLYRENTCREDKPLWEYLASNKSTAQKLFNGIDRIYLGKAKFSEGPFALCNLLTQLKDDPHWTLNINSLDAAILLEKILPKAKLIPSARQTLASIGKSVKSVSLEVVLLNTDALPAGCAKVPKKIPTGAVVDIVLEEAAEDR